MLMVTLSDIQMLTEKIGVAEWNLSLIEQLKHDFAQWSKFHKCPRHVTHYDHGVMELMPAATDESYVYKFVNGHPRNPGHVDSGYPLMISEMTLLTALRTAATSALASQYMAKSDSTTMAMIGCGAQSEFQTLAHHYGVGIDTVRYFDIDEQAMQKFEQNLSSYPLTLQRCSSIDEAVLDADIITTATAAKV